MQGLILLIQTIQQIRITINMYITLTIEYSIDMNVTVLVEYGMNCLQIRGRHMHLQALGDVDL